MSTTESEDISKPARATLDRALPRRRFFSDMPDKGLFVLVALAGFGAILFLKSRSADPNVITFMSVALMIGYGIVAYNMPAVNMRLDRLGDNFYYLGFIYTLASLSSAIMQVQESADIDQLIGSFGIALVTTIIGIAGRVMFVQMRSDMDEIEDTVRRDLSRTAAELRGELLVAIREFQTVRTAFVQTLQETSAAFAKACESNTGKLDDLMQSAAKKLEEAFEPGRTGARQVNEHMQAVAKSVEQATARISAIDVPSEKLNAQIADFVAGIDAQLRRLGATIDDASRRAVIPNEEVNSALLEFTKNLDVTLKRLGRTIDQAGGSTRKRRWYWPFRGRAARSE